MNKGLAFCTLTMVTLSLSVCIAPSLAGNPNIVLPPFEGGPFYLLLLEKEPPMMENCERLQKTSDDPKSGYMVNKVCGEAYTWKEARDSFETYRFRSTSEALEVISPAKSFYGYLENQGKKASSLCEELKIKRDHPRGLQGGITVSSGINVDLFCATATAWIALKIEYEMIVPNFKDTK